jgi:hypothetical protein
MRGTLTVTAAVCSLAFAAAAFGAGPSSFVDQDAVPVAAGDPDIASVSVVEEGDDLGFSIAFAPGTLAKASEVLVYIDSDQSKATGDPDYDGMDEVISTDAYGSLYRWSDATRDYRRVAHWVERTVKGDTLKLEVTKLGLDLLKPAFNFVVVAVAVDAQQHTRVTDQAPGDPDYAVPTEWHYALSHPVQTQLVCKRVVAKAGHYVVVHGKRVWKPPVTKKVCSIS